VLSFKFQISATTYRATNRIDEYQRTERGGFFVLLVDALQSKVCSIGVPRGVILILIGRCPLQTRAKQMFPRIGPDYSPCGRPRIKPKMTHRHPPSPEKMNKYLARLSGYDGSKNR
jgi:hypothetical protein